MRQVARLGALSLLGLLTFFLLCCALVFGIGALAGAFEMDSLLAGFAAMGLAMLALRAMEALI